MQALKRIFSAVKTAVKGSDRPRTAGRFENTGRTIVSLAVVVLITTSSVATVMAAAQTAHIVCDGKQQDVEITSEDTDKILQKAGIQVGPEDIVFRSASGSSGNIDITIKTAMPVHVTIGSKEQNITAHWGDTVSEVLSKAGIAYDSEDEVIPSPETKVSAELSITVLNRYHVSVMADGKTSEAVVGAGPVSQALSEAGVSLNPEDQVSVSADADVADGMRIQVTRVSYQKVTKTEPVAYSTVTKKDSTMLAGTKKVATSGKNGVRETVVSEKLVDGQVAESKVVQSSVVSDPVDQVTLVGTRKVVKGKAAVGSDGTLVDQNGNTVRYRKVVSGRCSAYTGGGYTSTGKKAAFGLVAVNPNVIPYGSRLYICSPDGKFVYGYAVAADTGGAAKRGAIIADLYYDTYNQCVRVGSRTMNVYIL